MEVALRLADHADERDIHELDELARAGDVERTAVIHDAVTTRCCLVAEVDRIVGYAVIARRRFFARNFLELLVVHEEYRRRGVGRSLLRAVVDRAGTSQVFSSTNESNFAMRSVFAHEGWTLSGQLDELDERDPEVVYFVDL